MDGTGYLKMWIGDLAFQLAAQRARIEELESLISKVEVLKVEEIK